MVIATGEGFVGEDEKAWMARPLFARRAMAQTRAVGRACRAAFAFVIPLIDANLQTTPAEEMDFLERIEPEPPKPPPARPTGTASLKERVKAQAAAAPVRRMPIHDADPDLPPPPDDPEPPPLNLPAVHEPGDDGRDITMSFGSAKGVPLRDVDLKSLKWYAKVLGENVEDESKARFRADNQAKLEAIEQELASR